MVLVHTCRASARSGRPRFVPGGLACAAARRLFTPTPFEISPTLKMRPGLFADRSIIRLAPTGA